MSARWLVLVLCIAGCRSNDMPIVTATVPPWFEDVTASSGIDFRQVPYAEKPYFMPTIVGCGVACFDADSDGRLDLLFLQGGGSENTCRFYRQTAPMKFVDHTAQSGLGITGHNMGATIGDVNNDGRPDVVITQYGGVRLFLNDGEAKFRDASKESGILDPMWATSCAFLDYDRDGKLDLFVANYVDYDSGWPCSAPDGAPDFCAPKSFSGTADMLFHNRGNGQFEDVSLSSGIAKLVGPGLGVICADLSGDGWTDIFVANDGHPNRLWINQHNGTFRDEAVSRGVAYNAMGNAEANMGIAPADFDGDGLIDLYVTHLANETNRLWKQGPPGAFRDRTVEMKLNATRWRGTGFGTVAGDFDCDGLPDLAVMNGRVAKDLRAKNPHLGEFWGLYGERNQVFRNVGNGFDDVSIHNPTFCDNANIGRGLIAVDLDDDGGLDLVTTAVNGPAQIYRNVAPNRGHWVRIRAIDPASKRDAIGTELVVVAGEKRYLRVLNPAESFLCASAPEVHVGLGGAEKIDRIEVRWPDGAEESFPATNADRRIVLRKGSATIEEVRP